MIERVSIWSEMTQKIYRLILEAYENGIKEYTSKDVLRWWEAKYGKITNIDTKQKIVSRITGTGGMTYVKYCGHHKGLTYHSLREENINSLRYQLSLKSLEHKNYRLTPTKESIYARFDKEIAERLSTKNNKELLDKIKTMNKEQIEQFSIADLPFTHRVKHCFACDNINTIGDLIKFKTKRELLRTPNFGQKCIREVEYVLTMLGLTLEK